MEVNGKETGWDDLIKKMIRSKQILHNKICKFYIYNSETYHFKADLIEALKIDKQKKLSHLINVCENLLAESESNRLNL